MVWHHHVQTITSELRPRQSVEYSSKFIHARAAHPVHRFIDVRTPIIRVYIAVTIGYRRHIYRLIQGWKERNYLLNAATIKVPIVSGL